MLRERHGIESVSLFFTDVGYQEIDKGSQRALFSVSLPCFAFWSLKAHLGAGF